MATTIWNPNAQATAQVEQATVTAAAVGGTLTATINGKTVVYTCVTGDTITSAAANWFALLNDTTSTPPEFQEITWTNPSAGVVLATASVPGTPFAGMTGGLVFSGAGGATVTQTSPVANSSPSSAGQAANWLRAGSPGLPQNGDDVIVADSSVPILWDLDALAAIQFATYTRWQTFTAQIGLPHYNPLGYIEYRPTYFQFDGPGGALPMTLGYGAGTGPTLERYDVGSQVTTLVVLNSGAGNDDVAIRFLTTGAATTVSVVNTSVAIATLPGESSSIASVEVGAGGSVALGPDVTVSGNVTVSNARATLACAPASLDVYNGSQIVVQSTGLTYAAVTALTGSSLTWNSNSTITTLVLASGASLDKSGDQRAMTITNSTIDGDTCQIVDPYNAVTYTNATNVKNLVNQGPFQFGPGRTVKIT